MAAHLRKQLRDAAKSTLTGLATTGANVFRDRDADSEPFQPSELPALNVKLRQEQSSSLTVANTTLQREAVLEVEAYCKHAADTYDTLDQIAQEVEVALANNPRLNGLCQWLRPDGYAADVEFSTNQRVGRALISYRVRYLTSMAAPDVPK